MMRSSGGSLGGELELQARSSAPARAPCPSQGRKRRNMSRRSRYLIDTYAWIEYLIGSKAGARAKT
jgi:hypothetical protein